MLLQNWIVVVLVFVFPTVFGFPRPQEEGDLWKKVPGVLDCDINRPKPYKIPDSNQCDIYYLCDQGNATPQLCLDGTVFQFSIQGCILLNNADCSSRPLLQTSNSSKSKPCERKTGLFPHEDPSQCDKYWRCLNGDAMLIQCPDLLLFDRERGVCDYADQVKDNCHLPPPLVVCPVSNGSVAPNLENRLPHPHDCQKFFLCDYSTNIPRPMACEQHQGFDLITRTCVDKRLLPNCDN